MKKDALKIISLLLALTLVLAGCGSTPEDVGGKVEQPTTQATTVPTTPAEATAPQEKNPLSLGRMEGGIYTNKYVGFHCRLDENWTFYSAEELQQLPSAVAGLMEGSELGDALEGVTQFSDMMAENLNDLTTINILYQQLSMQERLTYALLTEEQVVDTTLDQKDALEDAYKTAGMTLISMEKTTVTFLGKERVAIKSEFSVQDIPYFTLQFFDYHLGKYSVTTTLASYVEDNTASLLELFSPIE